MFSPDRAAASIAASAAALTRNVACLKAPITGVSVHANLAEPPVEVAVGAPEGETFAPVEGAPTPMRLAEPFERLRDLSDALLLSAGARPKIRLEGDPGGRPEEIALKASGGSLIEPASRSEQAASHAVLMPLIAGLPPFQHDLAARLAAFQQSMRALQVGGVDRPETLIERGFEHTLVTRSATSLSRLCWPIMSGV